MNSNWRLKIANLLTYTYDFRLFRYKIITIVPEITRRAPINVFAVIVSFKNNAERMIAIATLALSIAPTAENFTHRKRPEIEYPWSPVATPERDRNRHYSLSAWLSLKPLFLAKTIPHAIISITTVLTAVARSESILLFRLASTAVSPQRKPTTKAYIHHIITPNLNFKLPCWIFLEEKIHTSWAPSESLIYNNLSGPR